MSAPSKVRTMRPSAFRPAVTLILMLWFALAQAQTKAQPQADTAAATRVYVLGVDHAAQLVAKRDSPALLEAFLARSRADAICVERTADAFARDDFYEFTYEVQDVAVPYARAARVELCPIDWMPSREDELLGFGMNLGAPPELRPYRGFQQFLTFPEPATLRRTLYHADDAANLDKVKQWALTPAASAARDLPRRMFLYRTFMQAQAIARAAHARPGKTLVVVVGEFHKHDIESILKADPRIDLRQPSSLGLPSDDEIARHTHRTQLLAIANFNLLGMQSRTGNIDFEWMRDTLARLSAQRDDAEVRLLTTRLARLDGSIDSDQAQARYAAIANSAGDATFTWTGVLDRDRLDSYFDPFGNLSIAQRARVEQARELHRQGKRQQADALQEAVAAQLKPRQARQLRGYWTADFLGDIERKPE